MKILVFLIALIFCQVAIAQDQMYDICPLKVGAEIPSTSLVSDEGKPLTLQSLTQDKSSVLIFYRGAWCGYCIQHLAELNDAKTEIEELGFQLIGITPDKSEKLEESDMAAESEIEVYSDAKLETIMAFGLDWKLDTKLYDKYVSDYKLDLEEWSGEDHHSLPVPAIFIIKDNIVQFQYVNPNYRTRLSPETLIAILKTL